MFAEILLDEGGSGTSIPASRVGGKGLGCGLPLVQPLHEVRHLDGRDDGIVALVSDLAASALQRLLQRVGGDDAEDDGHAAILASASDAPSCLAGHVVEVERLSSDHRPQADHRVIAAALRHVACHQGELEGARNVGDVGVVGLDSVAFQAAPRARQEPLRDEIVEAGDDDGEAKPLTFQTAFEGRAQRPSPLETGVLRPQEVAELLALGLQVAFSLLIVGIGFTVFLWGPSHLYVVASSMFGSMSTEIYIAIPLFILMGNILAYTGIADELFTAHTGIKVSPVSRIEDRILQAPGPISTRLMDVMNNIINFSDERFSSWFQPLA